MKNMYQNPRNISLAINLKISKSSEVKLEKMSNNYNGNIIIKYMRCENIYFWNRDNSCDRYIKRQLPNTSRENEIFNREMVINQNDINRQQRRKRIIR